MSAPPRAAPPPTPFSPIVSGNASDCRQKTRIRCDGLDEMDGKTLHNIDKHDAMCLTNGFLSPRGGSRIRANYDPLQGGDRNFEKLGKAL